MDFCKYVDPEYIVAPHLRLLGDNLEALERGDIDRLIVATPPRHGKSRTAVQLFVPWFLGRNPKAQVIIASAGAELAEQHSRTARAIIEGNDAYPFETTVDGQSRAADRWQTTQGGIVRSAGQGGLLTGFGAHLLVCDDLVRDAADAFSPAIRESTWNWYATVASTRLMPKGKQLLIGTRWHESDIIGRVLNSKGAERWTQLILPAIAEDDDILGRAPGEALWPEWFPLESYPTELSSAQFQSLYQQRPVALEGNLFKREWFERRYTSIPERSPVPVFVPDMVNGIWNPPPVVSKPTIKIQAIDTASKTGVGNDWSVIATLASDHVDQYIVDIRRERVEFADLVRMILDEYWKHKPDAVYIEDASAGIAVIQELRRQTALPIIAVPARSSKIARAEAVSATFEAKRVLLPERASWITDFLDEMCSFPAAAHDDRVDAVVLGVTQLRDSVDRADQEVQYSRLSRTWMVR